MEIHNASYDRLRNEFCSATNVNTDETTAARDGRVRPEANSDVETHPPRPVANPGEGKGRPNERCLGKV